MSRRHLGPHVMVLVKLPLLSVSCIGGWPILPLHWGDGSPGGIRCSLERWSWQLSEDSCKVIMPL